MQPSDMSLNYTIAIAVAEFNPECINVPLWQVTYLARACFTPTPVSMHFDYDFYYMEFMPSNIHELIKAPSNYLRQS